MTSPASPAVDLSALPREQALEAALAHPAVFAAAFCMIHDPNSPELGAFSFRLWPWQWRLLDLFTQEKRVVILKARQLGVSWMMAAYALWTFTSKPGSSILFISKREDDAKELLAKAVFMYRRLPPELQFRPSRKDVDSGLQFSSAETGSSMKALAAVRGVARSETATLVMPDEWAFQEYAAEMYAGFEPTTGMAGEIKGCSTASGASGFFYAVYQGARDRRNGFFPVFLPYSLRPGRTPEWREQKAEEYRIQGMPEMIHSEYPEDDLEAFAASRNSFFPLETQRDLLAAVLRPLEVRWDPDGAGRTGWRIYQKPSPARRYVMGADVALGVSGGDFHAACILDAGTRAAVAVARLDMIPPDIFALRLDEMGRHYNNALLAVERNNHGILTIATLERTLHYPNLYRPPSRPGSKVQQPAGWLTTSASKPSALLSLRSDLASGSLSTADAWLAREVQFYEQRGVPPSRVVYGAQAGYNDDVIMAYAIAAAMPSTSAAVRRGARRGRGLSR